MRVLYIGQLKLGGTCYDRMQALKRLGHEVVPFDVSAFESKFRLIRSAQCRLNLGFLLTDLNEALVKFAPNVRPLDLIWIDKGVWIFPATLVQLRLLTGSKIVHYTPDAQLLDNRSKHFIGGVKVYDFLVTTKSFEVAKYREYGAPNVILVSQSFCPVRFHNPEHVANFACNVGLISDYKFAYGEIINALSSRVDGVRVWGPKWSEAAARGVLGRDVIAGGGLWGPDYVNGLASFDIGLGLLSKYIPELHTTRSVEVPAAGTFLLAERTSEHQAMFEEGTEADFFDSKDELVSKAKFYLSNADSRKRIAAKGRERCYRSGYDIDSTFANIFRKLLK